MSAINTICHFEIPTTDFARSKSFYEALFGWQIEIMPAMDYAAFSCAGGVGGGFNLVDVINRQGIQVYIYVEDIPTVLEKAKALGGEILREKTEIGGGHGCFAFFADCCGAQIGVWSKE